MPTASLRADVLTFRAPSTPATPATTDKRRIQNDKTIQGLRPPTTKPVEDYPDALCTGLSLRITKANHRSWCFRYVNPQGDKRRLVMGSLRDLTLAQARRLVTGYQDKDADGASVYVKGYRDILREGKDPAQLRVERRKATTFDALFDGWLAVVSRTLKQFGGSPTGKTLCDPKKAETEGNRLRAEFASLKGRVADEVETQDILAIFNAKTEDGFRTIANHLKKDISRIYEWGKTQKLVTINPAKGIKLNKTKGRKRVMTSDELLRLWRAADTQRIHLAVWFRLRLLTGQRGGELLLMRWSDIDTTTHWWTIPGEFTKNGEPHPVYLSTFARELLATLPRSTADGPFDPTWVFPAGPSIITRGKNKGTVQQGANTATLDVMGEYTKIGFRLAQATRANILNLDFRPHDLRRTMTTFCTASKVDRALMKKVLNHTSESSEEKDDVTAVYDRYEYAEEKEAIMEWWAKLLRIILAGGDVKTAGRFKLPGSAESSAAVTALRAIQALLTAATLTTGERAALDALFKMGLPDAA